jgi:hypothetical protein
MGIRLYKRPALDNPVLIAGWPGIGNIGIIAVHTLKSLLMAEEFGEIEPWDFFYPTRLLIKKGRLEEMEFPSNKFYFKKAEKTDIIFFIGEEQPSEGRGHYAEGRKAYQLANLVLDVAEKFKCRRIYTSGAAVSPVHHTVKPRVWAVPNTERLINEVRNYDNTVVMSQVEGRGGQGAISGLNGLLLGVARQRRLEGICLMGEIPMYLQGLPIPYPKASKSVLEVLTASLGLKIKVEGLDDLIERSEREIENIYDSFPLEVRERLDKLKYLPYTRVADSGPITEEDKKKILEDIDKFFKRETKEG